MENIDNIEKENEFLRLQLENIIESVELWDGTASGAAITLGNVMYFAKYQERLDTINRLGLPIDFYD